MPLQLRVVLEDVSTGIWRIYLFQPVEVRNFFDMVKSIEYASVEGDTSTVADREWPVLRGFGKCAPDVDTCKTRISVVGGWSVIAGHLFRCVRCEI